MACPQSVTDTIKPDTTKHIETTLDELVVETQRTRLENGTMMVLPQPQNVKMSQSVLDLLKYENLPGLAVNPVMQTISCFGKDVIIKVNGVKKSISYISGIDPQKVARIEYDDSPTARYLDGGEGGVINIILKRADDGGSIYAWMRGAPTTGFIDGNLNGSYNRGESQFEVTYYNSWRDYDKRYVYSDITYAGSDGFRRNEKFTGDPSDMMYLVNNLSATYTFQNKSGLMTTATFTGSWYKNSQNVKGMMSVNGATPYFQTDASRGHSFTPTLDWYLSKKWQGGDRLEANIVLSTQSQDYLRNYEEDLPGTPYLLDNSINNSFKSVVAELQYVKKLGALHWTLGANELYSHSRNDYDESFVDRMNRNNTYVYTSLSGQHGGFSWTLGGGGKYLHVKENARSNSFWQGRANAKLSYSISPTQTLSLYFAYTPTMPSLSQLATVEQANNSFITTTGNPDLKGAHPVTLQLGWWKKIGKFTVWSNAQNYNVNNAIMGDYIYTGNGKFLSTYVNFQRNWQFFLSSGMKLSGLFDHLDISFNPNYVHTQVHNGDYRRLFNHFSFYVDITGYWGNFSADIFYKKPGQSLWGYNWSRDENGNGLMLDYKWRNFRFGAGVLYAFGKLGTKYDSRTYNPAAYGSRKVTIENNSWMAILTLTYQTNFGKIFQKERKGLNNSASDDSMIKVF